MPSPGVIREFYLSKTSAVFYILRKTFSTSTKVANKELSFGQTKKSLCVIISFLIGNETCLRSTFEVLTVFSVSSISRTKAVRIHPRRRTTSNTSTSKRRMDVPYLKKFNNKRHDHIVNVVDVSERFPVNA